MAKNKELINSLLNNDESDTDKIINELTPDENKIALELLEEKIDGTETDTPPSKSTEEPGEKTDTSEDDKTKKEEEAKPGGEETPDEEKVEEKDFTLTEEIILKQPEENQGILNKYKDKSKEDMADAIAHAVALKSPYLKDNEKVIAQMKEQFLEKTGDELIGILVETQKESGKVADQELPPEPPKIILPDIPEDDLEINKILEKETLKRLKAKYPKMPDVETMDSEEYKEWRRDLDADNPDNNFRTDKSQVQIAVKEELSKVIYIQKELPNLYQDSPTEVLPLFTQENLPRLKALNDNPMNVLTQDIQKEIELIRSGLKKKGLTEKDLNIDLTITKDEDGKPYNEILNKLMTKGKNANGDPIPSEEIIGIRGKTFWLKQGTLARKFKEEFEDVILTEFVNKKTQSDRLTKDKLKDETLREPSGKSKGGGKALTVEDIEKETNPERIKQILADMEKV